MQIHFSVVKNREKGKCTRRAILIVILLTTKFSDFFGNNIDRRTLTCCLLSKSIYSKLKLRYKVRRVYISFSETSY